MAGLLSSGCEYGIRAVLYLTTLDDEGFVPIGDISEALDISFHFLTKNLQKLTEAGILHSHRGPKGGIALARPPETVTLLEVVLAIDGPELFQECVLGLPGCGDARPCPIHDKWADKRQQLRTMFAETSLAEAAGSVSTLNRRLAAVQRDQ